MPSQRVIEAAGGVLWRPRAGGNGVEVALVHRPKYDDWSLPKGKLDPGEHVLLGALREIREETGFQATPGRPLGEIHYLKDGEPKRVRYWATRAVAGAFSPSDEVDQIVWLPAQEAQRHLVPQRDGHILGEFDRDTRPTWPCLLVRHGCAGERAAWPGDDRERPLDEEGYAQAEALTPILDAYKVQRVISADVLRCLDTVGPYAERRRLPVESEPLVSEGGTQAHPEQAVDRLRDVFATGDGVAVCSQGKAIPVLLDGLCRAFSIRVPPDLSTRKGGFWALHMAQSEGGDVRLTGLESLEPPK